LWVQKLSGASAFECVSALCRSWFWVLEEIFYSGRLCSYMGGDGLEDRGRLVEGCFLGIFFILYRGLHSRGFGYLLLILLNLNSDVQMVSFLISLHFQFGTQRRCRQSLPYLQSDDSLFQIIYLGSKNIARCLRGHPSLARVQQKCNNPSPETIVPTTAHHLANAVSSLLRLVYPISRWKRPA
jgi:hypothetical protein